MGAAALRQNMRLAIEMDRRGIGLAEAGIDRSRYAGDPLAYFHDILGVRLHWQGLRDVIQAFQDHDRILIPSGNNLGKTFGIACLAVYCYDCLGSVQINGRPQGARIALAGPSAMTVQNTIYAEIMARMDQAESRGHRMPGRRSKESVLCKVDAQWLMEGFSPPAITGQRVAHTASGRHHRNQHAFVEEAQGVREDFLQSLEGMCSGDGNKIIAVFNPTETRGAPYRRSRQAGWHVVHLKAFEHPNISSRSTIIPGAISHGIIDKRVANEAMDIGKPGEGREPDDTRNEFLYALPPKGAGESGGRKDGIPGHPTGEARIYRPTSPAFEGQVLGVFPSTDAAGLVDAGAWDKAVDHWRRGSDPSRAPDRVGVDTAREGADDCYAATAWGDTAEILLSDFNEQAKGHEIFKLAKFAERRIRIGELDLVPKGRGPAVAQYLHEVYPESLLVVDVGGVGSSPYDHLKDVLRRETVPVNFGSSAPLPLANEPLCLNLRTSLYVRAAQLIRKGLVAVPPDAALREEMLSHRLIYRERRMAREEHGEKERREVVQLIPKDEIVKELGRSPDRADAFVLALYEPPPRPHSGRAQPPGWW